MSERIKKASEMFLDKYNCSQAVLSVFSEKYGVDTETAIRIACGLGSGCRSADICGAVSGAVLVIGLKYGADTSVCNSKTEEFLKEFDAVNGGTVCRNLLGCDITTAGGREKAVREDLFKTRCLNLVASAVDILENSEY